MSDIPNTKEIGMFFHCDLYLKEKPTDISPADFSRLEVGFTKIGLQVWCNRHDCNVMHVDYQGKKHPANTTRKMDS
jgi:hypothetical protein